MSGQAPCRSCSEMDYASDSHCIECGARLTQIEGLPGPVGLPTPPTRRARVDIAGIRRATTIRWILVGAVAMVVVGGGALFLLIGKSHARKRDLMVAAATGDSGGVARLLDDGLPVDTRAGEDGYTALHFAAGGGEEGTAALLLRRGADVNALSNDGLTPLDVAVATRAEILESGKIKLSGDTEAYNIRAQSYDRRVKPVIKLLEQHGGTRTQQ